MINAGGGLIPSLSRETGQISAPPPLIPCNFHMLRVLTVALVALSQQPVFAACGIASFYGVGDSYHGRQTANGEIFNAYGLTAAHRYLPFGSRLRVRNQNNGRSVTVVVNDRGPFISGRILDLSYGAFKAISNSGSGVAPVCYSRV